MRQVKIEVRLSLESATVALSQPVALTGLNEANHDVSNADVIEISLIPQSHEKAMHLHLHQHHLESSTVQKPERKLVDTRRNNPLMTVVLNILSANKSL